jgi:hypothetical protein
VRYESVMKLSYALMVGASLSLVALGCGDDSTSAGGGPEGGGNSGGSSEGGAPPQGGTPDQGGTAPVGGEGEGGGVEGASVSMVVNPETMAAGDTVEVAVTVENFVLEEPSGQPNEDGHGHFHIYLDDASGGNYLLAGQTENVNLTIPANTAPGAHTLKISLGENSHAPVSPAVEFVVDITVE